MSDKSRSIVARIFSDQRGQLLPWMALLMILFLGFAGLAMDLGQAYIAYRELQASSDAAALAGGYAMSITGETTSQVQSYASKYGSAASCSYGGCPGSNVNPNLGAATITVTLSCNSFVTSTVGVSCGGPGANNAIKVVQTAQVQTPFIHILNMLGVHSPSLLNLTATSSASMLGAANSPYNIAVVVDSTGSMADPDGDGNCTGTREACAMQGVQSLLSGLTPCSPGSSSSSCNSAFDSVGLFVFPNVVANTAADASTCPVPRHGTNTPTSAPYSTPTKGATWSTPSGSAPNYELTSSTSTDGFLDNYSSTNAFGGTIASTTQLGIITGADSSSCGLTTPISGEGTYLAGAIYAAQSALIAASTANKGTLNALIVLTDGSAPGSTQQTFTSASGGSETLNANGIYPSMTHECQQGVTAAQYAALHGTAVYIVAYGAAATGCTGDTATYQDPCTNLQNMALQPNSSTAYPANFYSDATTANKGACQSTENPDLTLNAIFKSVANSLTKSRLIPN